MTMTSLVRDIFTRLGTAEFIELPPETRDEVVAYLEKAPTLLLRGLARHLRKSNTLVINVLED